MAAQMLSVIPKLEQLSPRVIRVLGCNPSHMTLQGTNTYLVGSGNKKILIDTGEEANLEYINCLKEGLEKFKCTIQDIVLTHWHLDHVGGIKSIFDHDLIGNRNILLSKFERPGHTETIPILEDGHEVKYTYIKDDHKFTTEGATLRAIHTPGHTTDHMVLFLEEENALFSGDCILGKGTTVFEDLYDYMNSLKKLTELKANVIYPGHGAVVHNGTDKVIEYINHRNERERQIIDAIHTKQNDGPLTPRDIVKIVYVGLLEYLVPVAEINVKHHLSKLEKEGRIVQVLQNKWKSKM